MSQASNFGGLDVTHFTKDMVLSNVSEYQIFKFYCHNFVEVGKLFRSDLRSDNTPSCSIKAFSKGLYYKDFGTGEYYDCFSYVQRYMKVKFNEDLNFQETLKVISNDLGFIRKLGNKKIIPSLNYVGLPDKINRTNTIIRIKSRDRWLRPLRAEGTPEITNLWRADKNLEERREEVYMKILVPLLQRNKK